MITQIKFTKLKVPEEKIITLQLHPNIKAKMRFNHERSRILKNPQKNQRCREESPSFQINTINSPSYPKKAISQMLPKKTLKPAGQMSSYQIYKQEQKQSKLYQKDKAIDWKESQWPKPASRNNARDYASFIRSKSFCEQRSRIAQTPMKKARDLMMTQRIKIPNTDNQSLSPKSRSIFIRTKDGKRKEINNRKYLQRLKHTLEVNYISTVRSPERWSKQMKPEIVSLSPRNKDERDEKSFSRFERKCNPRAKFSKSKFNSNKQKLKLALNDYNAYRPWSGTKGQLANATGQLSTFFPVN